MKYSSPITIKEIELVPVIPWKKKWRDFSGGPVVKNPPANAGDRGSIPGPGRLHMCGAAKPVGQSC